ncbi:hypothetical protein GH714_017302 [Hevea brasiliensis]|uniref:Uncharacterized protein n=1 Tax=Hevea brasiliensis TaxID=3981 RepID=A0A6A6LAG4_HEVBR|nr:hypothetical protein GH714_017302 [Hevea brasiliensis]
MFPSTIVESIDTYRSEKQLYASNFVNWGGSAFIDSSNSQSLKPRYCSSVSILMLAVLQASKRYSIDDGISSIAVPSKNNFLMLFETSGNLFILEQPESISFSSDANLEMLQGIFLGLLQFFRSKQESLESSPTVEGSSSIPVSLKYKNWILVEISGNLVIDEQPEKSVVPRNFNKCKLWKIP